MITFDEALARVLTKTPELPTERVYLENAMGRILAEDVRADVDMPPFDKSAMDGYACRRADLGTAQLRIIEEIAAGASPTHAVRPGTCARILTGAPLPEGADCVVMQEQTLREGDCVRMTSTKTADNICRKGEDVRAGDTILRAGMRIDAALVAVLAAVGLTEPLVSRRPRVTVLATGNELVEPSVVPAAAQIRNSNGPQLFAQALSTGALLTYGGILPDDEAALLQAIGAATEQADVLLLSGGVSTGDFDLVPTVLERLGYAFEFDSVAMQPGRPTVYARKGSVACFGLPGNPVSTFLVFELLVRPYLYKLMGHEFVPCTFQARLSRALHRKNAERQSTVPVRMTALDEVEPVDYHGSAHILALCHADGLVTLPIGVAGFEKGDIVRVRWLSA